MKGEIMKNIFIQILILLAIPCAALPEEPGDAYPREPVKRPLVLKRAMYEIQGYYSGMRSNRYYDNSGVKRDAGLLSVQDEAGLNLGYGLTNDLQLGFSMPYVSRELHTGNIVVDPDSGTLIDVVENSVSTGGLGDISFNCVYRVFTLERLSGAAGLLVKTPTGSDTMNSETGRINIGTGQTDAKLDARLKYSFDAFSPQASIGYRNRMAGKADYLAGGTFKPGDEISASLRLDIQAGTMTGLFVAAQGMVFQGSRVKLDQGDGQTLTYSTNRGNIVSAGLGALFSPDENLDISFEVERPVMGKNYPYAFEKAGSYLGTSVRTAVCYRR
jgi:hypothetical protein